MDASLERYIERVRTIASEPISWAAMVRRVREAAADLVRNPPVIASEHRRAPPDGYGRNLVYRDPSSGFVVTAMVWPPRVFGPPHDHGTWGVVAVLEGTVRLTNYERDDDESDPHRAVLYPLGTIEAGPGAVTHVLPPHRDFHTLGNPSEDEPALTLHTYGQDVRVCRKVDLRTGKVNFIEPRYLNETTSVE